MGWKFMSSAKGAYTPLRNYLFSEIHIKQYQRVYYYPSSCQWGRGHLFSYAKINYHDYPLSCQWGRGHHSSSPKTNYYVFGIVTFRKLSHDRTSLLSAGKLYAQFQSKYLHQKTTPSKEEPFPEQDMKKMSVFQKFKAMYRDYWYVLVPVHLFTSAIWFGSFYLMAKSGVDVAGFAEMLYFSEETVEKIRKHSNSLAGNLAISYLLYKVFTPVRYTVTVGGTTLSINYLKKWGYIKPIPKKEELKKMFEVQKDSLMQKKDDFKEKRLIMTKAVMDKLAERKRLKKSPVMLKRLKKKRANGKG